MQKVKGIKLACLAAFAILPVQAYALGLGKLTMHSASDEPLNATIELSAATTMELQSLEVLLGSAGVFRMAGIDRSEQLKAINFSLAKENGKNIIRLNTERPFRDPFLHLIINAKWANGSLLREYTALLDPAPFLTAAPASIQAPAVAKPVDVKPAPATTVAKTKKPSATRPVADAPVSPADIEEPKPAPTAPDDLLEEQIVEKQIEESLALSELEKQELAARVALLEQQIDMANRHIDMQNTDLALLQSKGQTGTASPEGPVSESAKLSAPDTTPAAPVVPEVQKPKVEKKPPVTEKKAAKSRVRPKPVEEKGTLDTIMGVITSSWTTMLGAGLALLLILIGLFVVLQRRRSIAQFEDSIISGTAVLDMSTAVSTEPDDSSVAAEASFLSDFVPGMGNLQADEVDPLAEAGVYMAYGRDEQAEEVLKDAAANDPDRYELKLKLLEIYQGRKDISSFETLAEELYPAGGNIPMDIWARVAEMGKTVSPENPLFRGELKVQQDTLFGDKGREEGGELGDLLDTTVSMSTEDIALPEDTLEIPGQGHAGEAARESAVTRASDFPVPDEEVLDLDLGDFAPDEDQETDSFDLDSLGLNLDELGGDIEESEAIDKGEIDYNLDDIDLYLGETDTEDTTDAALADTMDMPELGGIEDLNLDLESEDNAVASGSETTEVPLQDETLEFADIGDLTLTGADSDSSADTTGSGAVESSAEKPAGANEAGTKLDLARAYIEMDDKDSAQSLLEEVAKEGTDNQKNEARDLMNRINAG